MPRSTPRSSRGLGAGLGSLVDVVGGYGLYLLTFLPRRVDSWLAGLWGLLVPLVRRNRMRRVQTRMGEALGADARGDGWRTTAVTYLRMRAETHIQRLRGAHGRLPDIDLQVEGLPYLEAALEGGRGVLLWRMQFCSPHLAKRALADAGRPVVHLSNWFHGSRFPTRLGLRVFAPLYIRSEVRHLEARVVIPPDGSLGYLRDLLGRLEHNEIVSIFGELEARAAVRVALLGREMPIATGVPSLARRSGAPILTSYTVRVSPDRYRVVIEPPIAVDGSLDRRAFTETAVSEFGKRLEQAVRRHPESWNLWEAG